MSTCRYPGDDLYLAAQSALDAWTLVAQEPVPSMTRAKRERAVPNLCTTGSCTTGPRTRRVAVREGFLDIGRHLLAECLTLQAAVPRAIGMRRACAASLADLADDTRFTVADILDIYREAAGSAHASDAHASNLEAPTSARGAGPRARARPTIVWTVGRAVVYSPLYPVEAWVERVRWFIAAARQDDVWPYLSACGFQDKLFESLHDQVDQVEHLHAAQVRHGIAETCLGDTLAETRHELRLWLKILQKAGDPFDPHSPLQERPIIEREERVARQRMRSVPQRSPTGLDRASRERPSTDVSESNVSSTDAPSTDAPSTDAPSTDAPSTDAPTIDRSDLDG